MASFSPLIAIVGTTGTSKSRLAIDLAQQLINSGKISSTWRAAKVINGDAMQVYKGLDVITNKVTQEERMGVEHLLMDFRSPGDQYLVTDWVRDAVAAIDVMHKRREVPIVVGGTAYWIQNLIFGNRLASLPNVESPEESDCVPSTVEPANTLSLSIQSLPENLRSAWLSLPEVAPIAEQDPGACLTLHSLLAALDPATAARWHWKDARRVLTSLRVIRQHGMTVTAFNEEQAQTLYTRYNTLVFWLYSDPQALHPRLDARVDKMLESGLLNEVKVLRGLPGSHLSAQGSEQDYTTGIFQAIGYREFEPYLKSVDEGATTPALFCEGLERMKIATRQYARRQMQWLRNKLVPLLRSSQDAHLFVLNVDDPEQWEKEVKAKALNITEEFLDGSPVPSGPLLSEQAAPALKGTGYDSESAVVEDARRKVVCPICTQDPSKPTMIEEGSQWQLHSRTRKHRKGLKKRFKSATTIELEDTQPG